MQITTNTTGVSTAASLLSKKLYRERLKGVQILLSNSHDFSQAGPGRTDKQEQEEISCNHVPSF